MNGKTWSYCELEKGDSDIEWRCVGDEMGGEMGRNSADLDASSGSTETDWEEISMIFGLGSVKLSEISSLTPLNSDKSSKWIALFFTFVSPFIQLDPSQSEIKALINSTTDLGEIEDHQGDTQET